MRKLLILPLLLLLLFAPAAQAGKPQLTLMIYMTGSNLESEYFAATSDIQEMISSRYNQQEVTVLIMTGGSEKWWTPGISAEHLSIHRLERAKLVLEKDYPLASMAAPNPLTALLEYGYTHHPAEKYALIIWDHGSGPVNGVCMDTLFSGDMLLPWELNAALAASPFGGDNKLEWIGFDACLMANAETAVLLAPYARYMIASQETEPGRGWNYQFLKGIETDATGADTGRRIIDLYYDTGMTHTPTNNITLSLIDLSRIPAVQEAADAFFHVLNMNLTAENFSSVSVRRQSARGVGRAANSESDYDLVDLTSLATHYAAFAPQEARALTQALADAVLYSRSNIDELAGLSVYHPFYNKASYLSRWRADYQHSALSGNYLRYLDTYANIWLGEQLTSWRRLQPVLTVQPGGQTISLQLTASQLANFASAELVVLYASENYGYGFIYREAVNPPDENGVLSITYRGQQLIQVDQDGNPLADGLSYFLLDDHIVLVGDLSRYNRGPIEHKTMFLHFRPREDGALEFLYMEELLDNGLLNARHNVNLDDWEYFDVLYNNRVPTANAEGDMLPFEQWDDSAWYQWRPLDLRSGLQLRFSSTQSGSSDLAALIHITDTQGNLHATPLVPLQHLQSVYVDVPDQLLLDDGRCSILLTGYEVVSSDLQPVIKLRVRVTNKMSEPLKLHLESMRLNRCVPTFSPQADAAHDGIAPGATQDVLFSVPLAALEQIRTAAVDELVLCGYTVGETWDTKQDFTTLPLTLDFDFSAVITLPEEPQILAGGEQDGVALELLALRTDSADMLLADMRITNRTGGDIQLSLRDYRINRFQGPHTASVIHLPASCSGFLTVRFANLLAPTAWNAAAFCEDLFSAMQLSSIHSLSTSWTLTAGDDERTLDFTFPLTPAFDYAQARYTPMDGPLDCISLYEDDSLSVQLAGFAAYRDNISIVLRYENRTAAERRVKWTHASANGVAENTILLSEVVLPANTIRLASLNITPDGLSADLPGGLTEIELGLNVFGEDGSVLMQDRYHIDVCSPPAENGCFYADQLQLEVLEHRAAAFGPILEPALLLPEQPQAHRVTLSARTSRQAASAEAHLILIQDDLFIPVVSGIPLQETAPGLWEAGYCGLYVGMAGEPTDNFWVVEDIQTDDAGETWTLGMMTSRPTDHEQYLQRRTTLRLSGGAAALTDLTSISMPEMYRQLYTYAGAYIPQRAQDGQLVRFGDMPQKEYALWTSGFSTASTPARFALLPVQDFPGQVYVLYSFTFPDGSGCSLEPVPYPQAGTSAGEP